MADQNEFELQDGIIKDLGLLAYKSLITVNAGGFIVILTFIGNADLGGDIFGIAVPQLKLALLFFLAGIGSVGLGIALAYISAQKVAAGGRRLGNKSVTAFLFWMVGPLVLAFICFLVGTLCAIGSISEIPASPPLSEQT